MKVFLMLVWNLSVNVGVLLISDSVGMFEYVDEWDWMLLFLFHLCFAFHFIHESVPPFFYASHLKDFMLRFCWSMFATFFMEGVVNEINNHTKMKNPVVKFISL